MITAKQLELALPSNKLVAEWYASLTEAFTKYQIDSKERIAAFLSQCGHESGSFAVLSENLNYSLPGLRKVFPKYFPTDELAAHYARKPEKIANRVYANRIGNGNESSGDGWKFRGRGLVQVTGKENYRNCSKFLFDDATRLLQTPEYLSTKEGAVNSACWFWSKNNLNAIADTKDVLALTKRINGGTHGLGDRQKRYMLALSVL